jgi:hypothetical protein
MATRPNILTGDFQFSGSVAFTGPTTFPLATINNSSVSAGANIAESKVVHRPHCRHTQPGTVAAITETVYHAYATGTLLSATASIDTAPTGDHTITIDVKKSTSGGAYASVLSSTTVLSSSTTAKTIVTLTISGSPAIIAGDLFQVVVTVGGSTSAQGAGLCVDCVFAENGA